MGEKKLEAYLLSAIDKKIEEKIFKAENGQAKQNVIDNSKEINRKLERLKELYINEKITMDEYSADHARIKSELIVVDNSKKVNKQALREFLNSGYKSIYYTMNDVQKQALWRSIITEIVIDGHEIVDISLV
jgi:hypothetical protein